MDGRYFNGILLVLVLLRSNLAQEPLCANKCICKSNSQRDGGDYLKMVCGEVEKVDHMDELELLNVANNLVQL